MIKRILGLLKGDQAQSLCAYSMLCGLVMIPAASTLLGRPLEWSILWFGAFVIVPLGLYLLSLSEDLKTPGNSDNFLLEPGTYLSYASRLQTPAALSLIAAAVWEPGHFLSILLCLPWLGITGLIALYGLLRIYRQGLHPLPEFTIFSGCMFLAVGGGWTFLSYAGLRPMNFSDTIVILTGVHFHYAGFALPVLAGLAAKRLAIRQRHGILLPMVLIGIPLVAIGISSIPTIESVAAMFMAMTGFFVGIQQIYLVKSFNNPYARLLTLVSGVSLCIAMTLAGLYGARFYSPSIMENMPISVMIPTHGLINTLGFAVPGLLAWIIEESLGKYAFVTPQP
jgi:hypothetical protein